jgi:hypothetical protein
MMNRLCSHVAALMLAPALIGGTVHAGLLPPAANGAAIPGNGQGTHYATPVFGPVQACADIERQLIILNPSLVVGEPLHARLVLRPMPTVPKATFTAQMVLGGDLRVYVFPPGRVPPYQYMGTNIGTTVPALSIELEGMSQTRLDLRFAFDRDTVSGALFDLPGTYRLRITLGCQEAQGERRELEMGTFAIEVTPGGPADTAALEVLEGNLDAFRLLNERITVNARGESTMTPAIQQAFEEVVAKHREARLRPHCMVLLADHISRHDQRRGFALLDQLEKEYPNTPFVQEAIIIRHRILGTTNDVAAIRSQYLRFWTDPTMTMLVQPKSPYYTEFIEPHMPKTGTQWMLFEGPGPDPIGTGTDEGIRIALSEEVQELLGLPEFVTPEQLRGVAIPFDAVRNQRERQSSEF